MTRPLDPANDPDRYDPARELPPADDVAKSERPPLVLGRTGGRRSTLPELIGKDASFQDSPSPYVWVLGLLGVASFLLLVAFVFSRLSP